MNVHDTTFYYCDLSADRLYDNKTVQLYELLRSYAYPEEVPFFIFTDQLPSKEKVEQLMQEVMTRQKLQRNFIIITLPQQVRSYQSWWNCLEKGLSDIIEWTTEDDLLDYTQALLAKTKKVNDILHSPMVQKNIVGKSETWKNFLRQLIEVALFSQGGILLIGESGTGKELLARLIHTIDTRKDKKDLVLLDCTTIVQELSGSEFFGHEKGAYTNALQSREGAFATANGGTLFLDEIGELPLPLQAELLRAIQEGTYKKVGSNSWQKTAFRLVCATNRQLRESVADNKFRHDLYFRIADFELQVPSLRDRAEDVPLLAEHFLAEQFSAQDCPKLDDVVMEYLVKRDYPGNVRELRQLIRRIALRHVRHKKISIGEIPPQDRPETCNGYCGPQEFTLEVSLRKAILAGSKLRDLKNRTMDEAIKIALEICHGDKSMAAQKLGVTLRAIQHFRRKNKE